MWHFEISVVTLKLYIFVACSLWTRKPNTSAENGVFYGWQSESDCMTACLTSPKCVAFDFGPVGCVLHNNTDDLTTSRYAIGVTQFLLNRLCLPTSQLSTESPPTTAVSARTTSMSPKVFLYSLKSCHLCSCSI